MKQIIQNLRSGLTTLSEMPPPIVRPGHLLIKTQASLISAGTERMLVEFGKASLLTKAKSQPEKIKQIIDKFKTDGLIPTYESVVKRLDEPIPLGYCNAGIVQEVGKGVEEYKVGDRVISNGPHAEYVVVPKILCAKIPDGVSYEIASFTVLSSIGLQGIRLLQPTLGEKVVVYGLGLIGLITAQLLRANGCEVMGIDTNVSRLKLAESFGVKAIRVNKGASPLAAVMSWTDGKGVDAVIITASAKNDDILHHSAEISRKKGRIVLVGVIDLKMQRTDFYEKELSFQVSCSYGPGRYDDKYEQQGIDYPVNYVRWTEQRNFETILQLLKARTLDIKSLITHEYAFEDAINAYSAITGEANTLGVLLKYSNDAFKNEIPSIDLALPIKPSDKVRVGVIGAGNFSKMTLLPSLSKTDVEIIGIADLNGAASAYLGRKYGAHKAVTDYSLLLNDTSINAIFIAVGHHLHAKMICEVLEAGKHAFVEKPLALSPEDVARIIKSRKKYPHLSIVVGFNRRFSPHISKARKILEGRTEPIAFNMTINAGNISKDHWVQDHLRGGGRIIGEGCHFIDLMVFLAGSKVASVGAHQMGQGVTVREDKMSISLGFEDGSIGTLNYFANGAKSYPKESIEIFSEGRVIKIDNFRKTTACGFGVFKGHKTFKQDKGHDNEFGLYIDSLKNGGSPLVPFDEIMNVTLASFAAMTSAKDGRIISIAEEYKGIF